MKRVLLFSGVTLGVVLLVVSTVLFWASSTSLPADELVRIKSYSAAPASADRDTFTIMTYDLDHLSREPRHESNRTPNSGVHRNIEEVISLIRRVGPEFVGLQDVELGSTRSGGIQALDTLAQHLQFASGAQAVSWNERFLPASLTGDSRSGSVVAGQGLLSRFLLRRHATEKLPTSRSYILEDPFSPTPLAQVAVADVGGWPVTLINVDLDASDSATREKQARSVNKLYKRLARNGFPMLLFGNINSVWPSAVASLPSDLRSQLSEDETLSLLVEGTNLTPAFSEGAYITGSSINTYPSSDPTVKYDYIFYRPRRIVPTGADIRCGSGPHFPSRHCAVTMTFLLPRPKEQLPSKRIPDDQLPSMDSLMSTGTNHRSEDLGRFHLRHSPVYAQTLP